MERTLHIHSRSIQSLSDLYDAVEVSLVGRCDYFGRNLDALYDILSDGFFDTVLIHEKHILRQHLTHEGEEMSEYYKLLDVLTDADGIDIVFQDD